MENLPNNRAILLVEDDALIALDAELRLREAGYLISHAGDLASAFEILAREEPVAAILDYDLGDETSEPVAQLLRGRRIPFAVVSGHLGARLRQSGFDPAIVFNKPADYLAVAETLTA